LKNALPSGTFASSMSPKLKLTAYAVLLILSACFARGFYSNYLAVTQAAADSDSSASASAQDNGRNTNSNNPANAGAATNTAATSDTNAVVAPDTNAAVAPTTNDAAAPNTNAAETTETNVAAAPATNSPPSKSKVPALVGHAAKTPATALDVSAARGTMVTYLAAFVGAIIGLGLLIANDVTHFVGAQAVDFLFNDAGEGQRAPEYERAEAAWVNGKHLEAIQLMRDFLKKNPRDIYVALRIAEIYEKDLKNHLAAALEYEEVLKNKLPAERWGWSAIHLCNLYSKLNKSSQALALLHRIADEYPKTGAAKKARVRLGLAEPEPEADEEKASPVAEPEATGERPVVHMEAHPPELEPRHPSASPPPEASEPPKPSLPPGFRPKK
jgi:TolA-binding protein